MGSISFDGWLFQGTDKGKIAAKYLCFIVSITFNFITCRELGRLLYTTYPRSFSSNYSYTLMHFKSLWELQRSQSQEELPVIESETDSIKIDLMPVAISDCWWTMFRLAYTFLHQLIGPMYFFIIRGKSFNQSEDFPLTLNVNYSFIYTVYQPSIYQFIHLTIHSFIQ